MYVSLSNLEAYSFCIYVLQSCVFYLELLAAHVSDPEIITHPVDLNITAPSSAVFTCSASACDAVSFEWKRVNSDLPEKSLVSKNGTTSTLFIPDVMGDDVGEYYCVVMAGNKTSQSDIAHLQISGAYNYFITYVCMYVLYGRDKNTQIVAKI